MLAAGAMLFGGVLLVMARGLSAGSARHFLLLGVVTGLSEASDRQVVAALARGGVGRAFGNAQALAGIAALPRDLPLALFQRAGGPTAGASAAATALSLVIWLAATRRNSFGSRVSA